MQDCGALYFLFINTLLERYEFVMIRGYTNILTDFLHQVEPGKRFYAYRWLLDNFINFKGGFPTVQQLHEHLATVTPDPRINYQHVEMLQQPLPQVLQGIPQPTFMCDSLLSESR